MYFDVIWYRRTNVSEKPAASSLRVHTVTDLRISYVPEGPAQVGVEYTCGRV